MSGKLMKMSVANLLLLSSLHLVFASQGCPFDDGSCQEYCNKQGCNMGYCGHFAWTQCICRKCGHEWSWYDKIRYNPDRTVNQTEMDSLRLNDTSTLILTNNTHHQLIAKPANKAQEEKRKNNNQQVPKQAKEARLTTLLIPDLSDSGKLELNDLPDENSDKFLDYLSKNHERLVQATKQRQLEQAKNELTTPTVTAESLEEPQTSEDEETAEIDFSRMRNHQQQLPVIVAPRITTVSSRQQVVKSGED